MTSPLRITGHAVERFRERVNHLPEAAVIAYLQGPNFRLADCFGAPIVKLPGGQRAIIRDHTVITILPATHHPGCLDRRRQIWAEPNAQTAGAN